MANTNTYWFVKYPEKIRRRITYTVYGLLGLVIVFVNIVGVAGVIKKLNDPIPHTRIPEAYFFVAIFFMASVALGLALVALIKDVQVWFDGGYLHYKTLFERKVLISEIVKITAVKRIVRYKNSKTIMYDVIALLPNNKRRTIVSYSLNEMKYCQMVVDIIQGEVTKLQEVAGRVY